MILVVKLVIATLLFPFLDTIQPIDNEPVNATINHQGLERKYIYYAPSDLRANAPLVIVMHGFTGSAEGIMNYTKMNTFAAKEGFAVVYPQGTKDSKERTFWNVGYDFHAGLPINDIDFITKLVKHLQKKYNLSVKNTFATGMSNGGEMSYLLACQRPKVFRAVAPIAATIMKNQINSCQTANPPPIYAISGTADQTTNVEGDPENKDGWGAYLGIPTIIEFWAKASKFDKVETQSLPDTDDQDGSTISRTIYSNKRGKPVLVFDEVIGGRHDWPGSSGNEDIDATKEVIEFFKQHME
jgi:polyhydroxybutyrate depolymerase